MTSSDMPLHKRDPEAWREHLVEGNATQPRKRVSADVLVRDAQGRILLVDPVYKPDWDLPGGMAEANEPPAVAARREIWEELGLDLAPGGLLCVDWVAPHGPWDDLLNFLFDGGVLADERMALLKPCDTEIRTFQFCKTDEVERRLRPYVWRRVEHGLDAAANGTPRYLQDGHVASTLAP